MKTQIGFKLLLGVAFVLLLAGGGPMYRHWQRDRLREPLIQAVLVRDTGGAARLLAQGTDANARDVLPTRRTAWETFLDSLPFLHRQPEPTRRNPVMPTALMLAATGARLDRRCSEYPVENLQFLDNFGDAGPCPVQDQPATEQLLLDHGAEVNAAGEDGWTALMLACKSGNLQIARLLLKRGADINGGKPRQFTPLMAAIFWQDTAMAKVLLDAGADVNRTDSSGLSPLMLFRSLPKMTTNLLARAANVNAKTYSGTTALMMAAKGTESAASIGLLLAHGADRNARDWKGRTARSMAHSPAVQAALAAP